MKGTAVGAWQGKIVPGGDPRDAEAAIMLEVLPLDPVDRRGLQLFALTPEQAVSLLGRLVVALGAQ